MKKVVLISSVLSAFFASGCQAESVTSAAAAQSLPVSEINFKDISNHWAEASVQTAVKKKYVDGYADGTFRPEDNVSRAEFIKMVIAATKTEVSGEYTGSDWYKPYVKAATDKGILRENDFPIEEVNKPISRFEMSRIAVRASDIKMQNKALTMDDSSFMYNATKTGLIQGLTGGELGTGESTTRAQSVTIIERILTVNNGGKLEVDKAAQSFAEINLRGSNFETMWGIRVKDFPYTHHLGEGLDMVINKVVVIDHSDSSSAFIDLYKGGRIGNGQNSYTMAFDITMKNSTKKDHYTFYPRQSILTNDFGGSYSQKNDLKAFWMDQIGENQGWLGFNAIKEDIDRILSLGNTPRVELVVQSEHINFILGK